MNVQPGDGHEELSQIFSVFVNTFMTTRYGHQWRERGVQIRPADWMWMAFGALCGVMAFVFGIFYTLVTDVCSSSFKEDGIFREISYIYRKLTSVR